MKAFILALWILLCCASFYGQSAPVEAVSRLDIEVNQGFGMGIDTRPENRWKYGLATGIGVNYNYKPARRFEIRGGISEQVYYSKRLVCHPYPYVMEMDFGLTTIATRLIAGGDWTMHVSETRLSPYLGAAFYADIVHYARSNNKLYYLMQEGQEKMNLKDSFSNPVPGVQLGLGLRGKTTRIELRCWGDILTFKVPVQPVNKQRRSYIGIAAASYFDN
ncbi:MAG TPA: hypothetical protein PLC91_03620 [Candidatus Cloacimonadota bacterium]|nr:hypothetical protein [Candidatus Cloacimonadota bacterium]HQH49820.1 hypothetical protein [Candidatus Cloacimonadota bacterium]